jgi:hypothetical protein
MKKAAVNCLLFRTSEEIETATPDQVAAWLRLIVLCSERESGGVLEGALAWKESTAKFHLRYGGREMLREMVTFGLLIATDDSSDLRVFGYDAESEAGYIAMRDGGRKNKGNRRGSNGGSDGIQKPIESPRLSKVRLGREEQRRADQGRAGEGRARLSEVEEHPAWDRDADVSDDDADDGAA